MGRKVQIRASYQQDAGYLMRLSQAVELDPKKDPEWKTLVVSKLNELVVIFLKDSGVVPDAPSPMMARKRPGSI